MKTITMIALSACLVACGEGTSTPANDHAGDRPATGAATSTGTAADHAAAPANADNSGVNKRDEHNATLTPADQGGSESDRAITAGIRKAVVAEPGFSVDAQNVKIITIDGKVTLRGPVDAPNERDRIGELAKGVAGVTAVDNQLEVKQPK